MNTKSCPDCGLIIPDENANGDGTYECRNCRSVYEAYEVAI